MKKLASILYLPQTFRTVCHCLGLVLAMGLLTPGVIQAQHTEADSTSQQDTTVQQDTTSTSQQDTTVQQDTTGQQDTTQQQGQQGQRDERLPSLEDFRRGQAVTEGTSDADSPDTTQQQEEQGQEAEPAGQGVAEGLREMTEEEAAVPTYVRESFTYPQGGRMDPVTPPASIASSDAFPELSLTGIVFDASNPRESAALIRVGTAQGSQKPERHVVRVGDRFYQYEIADIEPNRVIINIHLLGTIRTMELVKEQTGSPTAGNRQRGGRR